MKTKLPIMWYEGMPLEPAIFQQNFIYTEHTRNTLLSHANPNKWGIVNLELDDTYLVDGILKIKNLECILPDLTLIEFPDDIDADLSINLAQRKEDLKKDDLFLFLVIPDNELSYTSSTAKPKYQPKTIDDVSDCNNADNKTSITYLKHNYSLYLEKTPPIGYSAIPLLKIKYTGVSFQFTDYIPPIMQISQSKTLTTHLEALIKSGKDKLKYLMNKDADSRNNFLIAHIASIVFSLEQASKCDEHPYVLYSKLVQCLNSALILFPYENMPSIVKYEHHDCKTSILPLMQYIQLAMDEIKEAYIRTQFARQDGMFAIMLPEDSAEKITIGITKPFDMNVESVVKWMNNAIITSEDRLTKMQDQRIIGAKREIVKLATNLDLESKDDMILMEINLDQTYVTKNKILCIMNFDLENMPESVVLFTQNPENI